MSAIARRWICIFTMALLGLMPSGCYVTDWRWIWEEDDDHQQCYYSQSAMPPAGAVTQGNAIPNPGVVVASAGQ
jgi:hypothetical protein